MSHPPLDQSCVCKCGETRVAVHGSPLGRFFCHCTICQSVYQAPSADVTVFWAKAIELPEEHGIVFKKHRPPPALRRGTCPECGLPVVAFLRLAPFMRLAFVPSRTFENPEDLPTPKTHIFYHSCVEQVDDDLPKVSGYWRSELAVAKLVFSRSS